MEKTKEQLYLISLLHGDDDMLKAVRAALSGKLDDNAAADLTALIDEAAHLSVGISPDADAAKPANGKKTSGGTLMIPLTSTIGKTSVELSSPGRWRQPLCPLSLSDSFFPGQEKPSDGGYDKLVEGLLIGIRAVADQRGDAFPETLLSLLYKYGSTVKSQTARLDDVSVYD